VALQEAAGLESVTDGKFRRAFWHVDFLTGFEGIVATQAQYALKFHGEGGEQSETRSTMVVDGKVKLEDKDELKRRVGEAARYVPLENPCLSPQCGFASSEVGNRLTEDDQKRKLALAVETAREIWG
jgi:methionine synthase II (cobalamin-independent)